MKKIAFDRESCLLAIEYDPPICEVKQQLRMAIGQAIRSFTETDGVLRDKGPCYEIACLMKALELLSKK